MALRSSGSAKVWGRAAPMLLALTLLALTLLVLTPTARAADTAAPVSRAQFQTTINHQQQVVSACAAAAKACDQNAVGDSVHVAAEGPAPAFTLRWDWLREALHRAASPAKDDRSYDRAAAMRAAADHLQELAAEAGGPRAADPNFSQARADSNTILARSEFHAAAPPSWLEREWNALVQWVGSLFDGFDKLNSTWSWLGTALEWLLYIGAAVGLLLFALRAFRRQRLAVSIGGGAGKLDAWDREATDWAALADACATEQQWRDAVHCLYWAAIVRLESRRAWRHNPARTPREYVRLLKPGSPQQGALRSLTQIFERVWYGLRDATNDDYQRARSLFDGLSETSSTPTQSPERA